MGGHYKNVITAQPKREDFHRPTNPSGSGLDLPSTLPWFKCSKFVIRFLFECVFRMGSFGPGERVNR